MVMVVIFSLVVIVMICGGMLLARLVTAAKSKGSWVWGFCILIVLVCIPLFLIGLCVWFLHFSGISSRQFSPF